jgi:8-oxo-dGTP diphosphatase
MLVPLNKIVKTGSLETRKGPSREAQERSALDVPGGRKRGAETEKQCLRREIKEELPKLKLGGLKLWKEVKARNRRSGRKMSDAIFVAKGASGNLKIGDKQEIDRATWRKPWGHSPDANVPIHPRQTLPEN